jgi:hypothetical protein
MSNKETEVRIVFPSRKAAKEFLAWLDGQGEQELYEYLRLRRKQTLELEYDHQALVARAKR